jgi:hypothetical protein
MKNVFHFIYLKLRFVTLNTCSFRVAPTSSNTLLEAFLQECKEGESLSGNTILPQKEQIKFKTFSFLYIMLRLQMRHETRASFVEFRMNTDV